MVKVNSPLSKTPESKRKVKPQEIEYYLKPTSNHDNAIVRGWNSGSYTQKNIADYFSIHYSRVIKIIKKAMARLDHPPPHLLQLLPNSTSLLSEV